MNAMWTIATALTDSLLFQWLALTTGLVWGAVGLVRLDRALEEARRRRDLAKYRARLTATTKEPTW